MAKAADRDRVAAALSGLPSRISSYGTQSRSLSPGRLKKMATDRSGGFSPISGLPGRQPARLLWVMGGLCDYVGVTTGVPQIAADLRQRPGRQGRAISVNAESRVVVQSGLSTIRSAPTGSNPGLDLAETDTWCPR